MAPFWILAVVSVTLVQLFSRFRGDSALEHRKLGQKSLSTVFRVCIRGLVTLGIIRIEEKGFEEMEGIEGPVIIASNHPALWDALLIMRHCDQVSCIMKASLLSNPLLRGGALFAGFLPNAPRLEMIRRATERLKSGGRLLLFPEGTRTREENKPLNPFYPGMALIACKSGAPLLPVFIETDSRYLQKGWPIWRMPDFPISIKIRVGELQQVREGEKARQFSGRMEQLFREQLEHP
ncbi:lysophospholipid acyltransferase family protein [Verrucomicrobiaceae bacterium 227]